MPKPLLTFQRALDLRIKFYALRNGKEALLKIISASEVAEQVYDSNAIENSTLTLEETEKILQALDIDRAISQRELFEARNLGRVVEYIDLKAESAPLTLDIILLLHQMLITNIRDDVAGRFRTNTEWVRVGNHVAPDPAHVTTLLTRMLDDYHSHPNEHIVKRIAKLHLAFEHIHPFVDGNGRIGRVLNNYLLIREGFVPINIKYSSRAKYYEALREYDRTQKTAKMEEIIGKALTNSYHKRLAYLEGQSIVSLKEYSKMARLSLTNLLNKAERQTIGAFTERGVWKIGIAASL